MSASLPATGARSDQAVQLGCAPPAGWPAGSPSSACSLRQLPAAQRVLGAVGWRPAAAAACGSAPAGRARPRTSGAARSPGRAGLQPLRIALQPHHVVVDLGGGLLVGRPRVLELLLVGLQLGDATPRAAPSRSSTSSSSWVLRNRTSGWPAATTSPAWASTSLHLAAFQRVEVDHVAGDHLGPERDEVVEHAGLDRPDRHALPPAPRREERAPARARPRNTADRQDHRAPRREQRAPPPPRGRLSGLSISCVMPCQYPAASRDTEIAAISSLAAVSRRSGRSGCPKTDSGAARPAGVRTPSP